MHGLILLKNNFFLLFSIILTKSAVCVIFLLFRYFTIFFAILDASFSSPKILITNFKSISVNLFTASKAEISLIPIVIFNLVFDLNENPLSRSSS